MTTTVFIAVIAAALLHAVWNAIVKGSDDKHLNMTAMVLGSIPIAVITLLVFPLPKSESWIYILASVLVQLGYHFSLLFAYEKGDLSQVYPVARGSAPLFVAVVSILFFGEQFNLTQIGSIGIIIVGILITTFAKQTDGQRNLTAIKFALLTACCIAAYSIIDALGGKLAGNPFSYFACIAIGYGVIFSIITEWQKPGLIKRIPTQAKTSFFIGGNATFVAYAIIVWAFTQASMAIVTALRETSISFALIIGVLFLKEKFNLLKIFAVGLTLVGAVVLKLAS